MRQILLFLLLFSLKLAFAQPAQHLTGSEPFYEKAAIDYQKWLDSEGLGGLLKIHKTEILNDTVLVVFLHFQTDSSEMANAKWAALETGFSEKPGGLRLENFLFEKVEWYFETPREQCFLMLADNWRPLKKRCRVERISWKNGQLLFAEPGQEGLRSIKSQDFSIPISLPDLTGMKPQSAADFQKEWSKKEVFAKLKPWLETRFSKPQPDGGWSHIKFTDEWQTLKFTVDDLRKEVISASQSTWLCEALCFCPTCQPHEKLEIVLKYSPLADPSEGFELSANVSAKYGSGIWKPREAGWHDLDTEPAKKELLRIYGDGLMYEIKSFLVKP